MKIVICLVVLIAFANLLKLKAEVVHSSPCDSANQQNIAVVNQVRVIPCPPPGDGASQPCKLTRGAMATIAVDFTPKRQISSLRSTLYHLDQGHYLPYLGLDREACRGLTTGVCPMEADSTNTWSANIKLSRAFPLSTYPLKIKIVDTKDDAVVVCETFTVELTEAGAEDV